MAYLVRTSTLIVLGGGAALFAVLGGARFIAPAIENVRTIRAEAGNLANRVRSQSGDPETENVSMKTRTME